MTSREKKRPSSGTSNPSRSFDVEDERGWAGQHGQRPVNTEEKSYRPDTVKENPENCHGPRKTPGKNSPGNQR